LESALKSEKPASSKGGVSKKARSKKAEQQPKRQAAAATSSTSRKRSKTGIRRNYKAGGLAVAGISGAGPGNFQADNQSSQRSISDGSTPKPLRTRRGDEGDFKPGPPLTDMKNLTGERGLGGADTRQIVGTGPGADSRYPLTLSQTQQYPYRCICKLIMRRSDISGLITGTGCVIGKRTILTCGHNLLSHYGSGTFAPPDSVEILPGLFEGSCTASPISVGKSALRWTNVWEDDKESSNTNDRDVAAIILPSDQPALGDIVGTVGMFDQPLSDNDIMNILFKISGYQQTGDHWVYRERQLFAEGQAIRTYRTSIVHNVDTGHGASGAPLIYLDSSSGLAAVAGVHVQEYGWYNLACGIDQDMLSIIKGWIAEGGG
jgi:V8-like Glu-specific endopeptidase